MPVELILDAETFVGLGAVTEGAQSALSPWNGVDAAITETRRAQLAAAGAIDAHGAKPELRPALAAMSAATATTTLLFTSAELQLEYLTWVSDDGGPVGLSATSAGTYRLQDPPPIEPMMSALADLIGRSGLRDSTSPSSCRSTTVSCSLRSSIRCVADFCRVWRPATKSLTCKST